MATATNGDVAVPPSDLAPSSPGKRKRDLTPSAEVHKDNEEPHFDGKAKEEHFVESLKDLLQVLTT